MDVREGYKQTEVGLLPQDWKLMEIGSLTSAVTKGTTPTSIGHSFASHGVRFIKAESVGKDGRILPHMTAYIEEHTHTVLRRSQLKAGDLLLSIAGVLGRVGRIKPVDVPANTNQALAIIRPNDTSLLDPVLFFNLLKSPLLQRQIEDIAVQGAQANISLGDVSSFILPFPPTLAEQQAIAEALSDADALIESLEQLIAKKRQIKQGAMQELLTGKRRLPGFEGEWEINTLDNLLDRVANGFVYLQDSAGDVNVTRIETIASGKIDYARVGKAKYDESLLQYRLQQGDILFSHINSLDHIGKVARYNGDRPLYHGMNLLLLRVNKHLNDQFFYYWLCSKPIRALCRSLAKQAVSQASINTSEIKQIEISHPGVEEQSAIGQVLSEIDRDIELVEEKLSKARLLKQGMMQELLTGRIRLV